MPPLQAHERDALLRLDRDIAIEQELLWDASADERRSYIAITERQLAEQGRLSKQATAEWAERAERQVAQTIRNPVLWQPATPPREPQRVIRHVHGREGKRPKTLIPQVDDDLVY